MPAATCAGKDVYIDELTVTLAPIALGAGHPLFAGIARYAAAFTIRARAGARP